MMVFDLANNIPDEEYHGAGAAVLFVSPRGGMHVRYDVGQGVPVLKTPRITKRWRIFHGMCSCWKFCVSYEVRQ